MPDEPLVIPVAGQGEETMAEVTAVGPGDLDNDCLEVLLEDIAGSQKILLDETAANVEQAGAIGRGIGNRLVGRVDPMEAAAVKTVLSGRNNGA